MPRGGVFRSRSRRSSVFRTSVDVFRVVSIGIEGQRETEPRIGLDRCLAVSFGGKSTC